MDFSLIMWFSMPLILIAQVKLLSLILVLILLFCHLQFGQLKTAHSPLIFGCYILLFGYAMYDFVLLKHYAEQSGVIFRFDLILATPIVYWCLYFIGKRFRASKKSVSSHVS